jgi:hypothetical protein
VDDPEPRRTATGNPVVIITTAWPHTACGRATQVNLREFPHRCALKLGNQPTLTWRHDLVIPPPRCREVRGNGALRVKFMPSPRQT